MESYTPLCNEGDPRTLGTRSSNGSSANSSCLEQPIPADESLAAGGGGDKIYENRCVQDCTEHTLLEIKCSD